MSWVVTPSNSLPDDPDAVAYIAAVEAADTAAGQSGGLETATKMAINAFVKGCKADGIWPAIKASCILAGARTRQGALVPLVKQPADSNPTFNGTAGGWNYNRKTGLQGNGTNNYINSGRNNSADPQNNNHAAVYINTAATVGAGTTRVALGAGGSNAGRLQLIDQGGLNRGASNRTASNSFSFVGNVGAGTTGLFGTNRASSGSYLIRSNSTNYTVNEASDGLASGNIYVLARENGGVPDLFSDGSYTFYSIGEFLDLAKLDTRVSALITAFGTAIA